MVSRLKRRQTPGWSVFTKESRERRDRSELWRFAKRCEFVQVKLLCKGGVAVVKCDRAETGSIRTALVWTIRIRNHSSSNAVSHWAVAAESQDPIAGLYAQKCRSFYRGGLLPDCDFFRSCVLGRSPCPIVTNPGSSVPRPITTVNERPVET